MNTAAARTFDNFKCQGFDIPGAISTGIDVFEATQLEDDLSGLRASMSNARLVIDRGEWGRVKNKDPAVLLSQLKDTTYDADPDELQHIGRSIASRYVMHDLIDDMAQSISTDECFLLQDSCHMQFAICQSRWMAKP
ncbi:hypothetical protein E2562_037544 [Oryza meyeriana var. granulata]|uniref:Uncharacterized protein n=1 Tax=Oryza meyeriana var. granulata TaxID=110450 RepID=A0A6G1DTB9_9ORYZ|nr:hypothetical protein E2562_037544 [Oryza meyeriana var. granulata]